MANHTSLARDAALEDFRRAHRQAVMQEILAHVTRTSANLMSFEEVRQRFKIDGGSARGLQEIPLEAIVGSVGRYTDFTRTFLPRLVSDQERWANVKAAATSLQGLPPIEVYQIGRVYFVLDGNHRVSVARQLEATHIKAYVTEFKTRVPLEPDDQPDDLIVKAEYADFLGRTHLDQLRPQADLRVTVPGRYWQLETHIEAHRFLMGQEKEQEISPHEAVCDWYDHIYLPVVQAIQQQGVLREFPNRTETDLYLWIFEHRAMLEKKLGWHIDLAAATTDLVTGRGHSPKRIVTRLEEKVVDALIPAPLGSGPATGMWRHTRLETRPDNRLFPTLMIPVTGEENGWQALEQALLVAQHEDSHVYGLHVVSTAARQKSPAVQAIQAEFERRCQAAGVSGELSIEVGNVVRKICDRIQWVDLLVMYPANPPGPGLLAKLSSGSRTIIRRSSRPVLMVPKPTPSFERVLLAYDGSSKAQEGLFVATYLASHWQTKLTVMAVIETPSNQKMLAEAQQYLEKREVAATFTPASGEVSEAILNMASEQNSDLIIMGGYGSRPIREVVLGNVVGRVLRQSQRPLLICR